MQVRSGGQAGRAHVADGLSLLDPRAAPDVSGESPEMAVSRGDAVQVTQLDQVTISARATGPQHDTVAGGHHWSAGCGRVVGALVPASQTEHGMKAGTGKAGGDAAELHRGPKKRTPQ